VDRFNAMMWLRWLNREQSIVCISDLTARGGDKLTQLLEQRCTPVIWAIAAAGAFVLLASITDAAPLAETNPGIRDKAADIAAPKSDAATCPRRRRSDTDEPLSGARLGDACRGCHPRETAEALNLVRTCLHQHCIIQQDPVRFDGGRGIGM